MLRKTHGSMERRIVRVVYIVYIYKPAALFSAPIFLFPSNVSPPLKITTSVIPLFRTNQPPGIIFIFHVPVSALTLIRSFPWPIYRLTPFSLHHLLAYLLDR